MKTDKTETSALIAERLAGKTFSPAMCRLAAELLEGLDDDEIEVPASADGSAAWLAMDQVKSPSS
jgi:hypothetical protein